MAEVRSSLGRVGDRIAPLGLRRRLQVMQRRRDLVDGDTAVLGFQGLLAFQHGPGLEGALVDRHLVAIHGCRFLLSVAGGIAGRLLGGALYAARFGRKVVSKKELPSPYQLQDFGSAIASWRLAACSPLTDRTIHQIAVRMNPITPITTKTSTAETITKRRPIAACRYWYS